MPRIHRSTQAVVLVLFGSAVLAVSGAIFAPWNRRPAGPKFDCSDRLTILSAEIGALVWVRFTIANRGDESLSAAVVRTSCACAAGLLREKGGKLEPVRDLELIPGQADSLALRLEVNGPIGRAMRQFIDFQTNDPNQPEKRLEILIERVTGGVQTVPTDLIFGSMLVETTASREVRVYDVAATCRRIQRVESTDPNRLRVTLKPWVPKRELDEIQPGHLVGVLEVTLSSEVAGHIDEAVLLHFADEQRPPHRLSVMARILPTLEVVPPRIVFHKVSNHDNLWEGQVTVTAHDHLLYELRPDSVPSGVAVLIPPKENGDTEQVVIARCASIQTLRQIASHPMRLQIFARQGERETKLEIPLPVPRSGATP